MMDRGNDRLLHIPVAQDAAVVTPGMNGLVVAAHMDSVGAIRNTRNWDRHVL